MTEHIARTARQVDAYLQAAIFDMYSVRIDQALMSLTWATDVTKRNRWGEIFELYWLHKTIQIESNSYVYFANY